MGSLWQRGTSWVCMKEFMMAAPDEFEYLGSAIVILNSYDILAAAPGFDYFIGTLNGYTYETLDAGTVGLSF